ncbi:hypothetical protein Taro_037959, partial [Colocasia esculenta]|nr:hypothetical protein [Colocasia esculenta]
ELRLRKVNKYCLLGHLSKEVGWTYCDIVRIRDFISIRTWWAGHHLVSSDNLFKLFF